MIRRICAAPLIRALSIRSKHRHIPCHFFIITSVSLLTYGCESHIASKTQPSTALSAFVVDLPEKAHAEKAFTLTWKKVKLESVSIAPNHYWQTPAVTVEVGATYSKILSFSHTLGYGTGSVGYQLSPNGTDWYYHDGSSWAAASRPSQRNSQTVVDANAATFADEVGPGTLQVKAYLVPGSSGEDPITLKEVSVNYLQ